MRCSWWPGLWPLAPMAFSPRGVFYAGSVWVSKIQCFVVFFYKVSQFAKKSTMIFMYLSKWSIFIWPKLSYSISTQLQIISPLLCVKINKYLNFHTPFVIQGQQILSCMRLPYQTPHEYTKVYISHHQIYHLTSNKIIHLHYMKFYITWKY